jgi:2-dehydropantoate 2-reductase
VKISILGAGALGSILAAHLARAGHEVALLARGARAAHLLNHGVRITGIADFTQRLSILTDPAELRSADALVVTVKTYDMDAALAGVRHVDAESVLSIQNGVYKDEQLIACFGRERTLGATAVFSGEVLADGAVRFTLNEALYVGELPQGTSPRVERLVAALNGAGIRAEANPQIRSAEWSKFVIFVPGMVISALTRLETYKTLKDPDLARLRVLMQNEMAALAAREGVPLLDLGLLQARTPAGMSVDEAVAELRKRGEMMEARGATTHKISTLQDLERGRRLEVDEILGYAVRRGRELGVDMPALDFGCRLLSGINRFLT